MRTTYSRPFWLIAEYRTGRIEVLRTTLASGEEALAVFSFEEEARMFLEFGAPDGGWRVRVTPAGELISVLSGPCLGVGWVALDPLPGPFFEALTDLASMGRDAFMVSRLGVQPLPVVRVREAHRAPQRPHNRVNGSAHEEASVMVEQLNRWR